MPTDRDCPSSSSIAPSVRIGVERHHQDRRFFVAYIVTFGRGTAIQHYTCSGPLVADDFGDLVQVGHWGNFGTRELPHPFTPRSHE